MPGSRLLPAEQRTPLPAAPTTSRWWRTHVLLRSWLNRHRRGWLAPLLVCVPPVGVAMVWAGATRPGHQRRWLTAAAGVWMIVLGLLVSLLALPGASPADAGGAPRPLAGGAPLGTPTPSATPTRDAASAAAAVRGAPARGAGVGDASVRPSPAGGPAGGSDGSSGSAGSSGSGAQAGSGSVGSGAAGVGAAPPATSSAPRPPAPPTPEPPRATPTPTPPRTQPKPPHHPKPPTVPTALPFTACSVEGAHAVSPNGVSLRCYRTPVGLYWLWG